MMKESAMIMEEGGVVLMNSINLSCESFDSCGRIFITILCLCLKPLIQSQYLFLRRFFFSSGPQLPENMLIKEMPRDKIKFLSRFLNGK